MGERIRVFKVRLTRRARARGRGSRSEGEGCGEGLEVAEDGLRA